MVINYFEMYNDFCLFVQKNYNKYIMITMHLITLTSVTLKLHPSDHPLVPDLMKIIIRLSKLRLRTRNKGTLLHFALIFFGNQR